MVRRIRHRYRAGRRTLESLPLLAQLPILPLQLPQLLSLLARQDIRALAPIRLVMAHPVTQRLLRAAQLRRELLRRAIPRPNNVIASRGNSADTAVSSSPSPLLPRAVPESITVSMEPGQLQLRVVRVAR